MKELLHNVRYPILIVLMVCMVKGSSAQSYYFRHYQVENGLSNNTVFCSTQDQDGFLWFGTKDGLNRFDGYQFRHYQISNEGHGLSPDIIASLLLDKQNTLWVGCQKGLFYFDRQKECLTRFLDGLDWVNNLHVDKEGQLWFTSSVELCRYNFAQKKLTRFPPASFFAASSICSDSKGDVWVSTTEGFLQRFDTRTQRFSGFNVFSHSAPASSTWIQKIYSAGNGALFVGTPTQGLKKFDINKGTYTDLLAFNPDKTSIYIRDIKQYGDNEYWLATESGIFILDNITGKFINLKKRFPDPYSLSDNAVYSLCKDKEGGIWAGTYFGGINYYSRQYAAFQKYFPDNSPASISGSAVREICQDGSGNMWIGTEDAGLNKLDPRTGLITQYKPTGERNSIAYYNIHGLMMVGDKLWIGTFDHGLDILDTRTGKVTAHYQSGNGKHQLQNNFVVTLLRTSSGEIYAGTAAALYRFNKSVNGFDLVKETPGGTFISALLEDHRQTIWVGTHRRGLRYFNPVTGEQGYFETQTDENSITNNIINAIFEDQRKNLWISTEGGGLVKLDSARKVFTSYTTKNGLPSNFIFKVLEDDNDHLWVTTSRGLVDFNPQNLEVTIYTKDNGLLNDQFNYNSGYKDPAGKMYFGSVKGMISFLPGHLTGQSTQAQVFITGFQVQNNELEIGKGSPNLEKSILFTDEIVLPHDHSSISIDFAALSFISPEMTTYSYFMKGLDNEWTVLKSNRKIYFTSLSPGSYTFKLKAAINGNWGGKERRLKITILPPFWATWWAYLAYAIFAFSLCYYLLRMYRVILDDRKEKEIYEAKIDFFTNVAHEIRTPLTLIKGPVENLAEKVPEVPGIGEDVAMMERNTNRLVALVTQILDFRKAEAKGFTYDFVKVNIAELLNESYLNFSSLAAKRKLDYTIDCPSREIIAMADEDALNKIFSNLLANAIKYAQTRVSIRLLQPQQATGTFRIEFENDGMKIPPEMRLKIFEPFFRLKGASKQQGTGIGLALAASLAELHDGDLYLEDSGEAMNMFVLELPLMPKEKKPGKTKKNKELQKIKNHEGNAAINIDRG